MIEVVSAVIIRHDRILLTQRLPEKDFAFTWECPGGKVEPEESAEHAMRRELLEELGVCNVRIASEPMWHGEFKNPVARTERGRVHVTFYRVFLGTTHPAPCEGQGIGWFQAAEMLALPLAPANARASLRLVDCLRGAT